LSDHSYIGHSVLGEGVLGLGPPAPGHGVMCPRPTVNFFAADANVRVVGVIIGSERAASTSSAVDERPGETRVGGIDLRSFAA